MHRVLVVFVVLLVSSVSSAEGLSVGQIASVWEEKLFGVTHVACPDRFVVDASVVGEALVGEVACLRLDHEDVDPLLPVEVGMSLAGGRTHENPWREVGDGVRIKRVRFFKGSGEVLLVLQEVTPALAMVRVASLR